LNVEKNPTINSFIQNSIDGIDLPETTQRTFLAQVQDMRANVEKESDRYMFAAFVSSALYLLHLSGVTFNLNLFGVEFLRVNHALFILATTSLVLFIMSAMRAADAAYYERVSDVICERLWPDGAAVAKLSCYGGNGVHHNIMDVPLGQIDNLYERTLLFISRFGVGLVVTAFAVGPILIGGTFIYYQSVLSKSNSIIQVSLISILFLSALVEGLLALRFLADEEAVESEPRDNEEKTT
jgi:hypothetical protein